MKVLIVTEEYYPLGSGIANTVYNCAEELKNKGHECTVENSDAGDIKLPTWDKIQNFVGIVLIAFWISQKLVLSTKYLWSLIKNFLLKKYLKDNFVIQDVNAYMEEIKE
jgi:glycogen synthase